MSVALASSGTNTTPATPLAVSVTVAANDYLVASYVSDSTNASATPTYDSPLVQDFTSTSNVDGMRFHAASGRAGGSDTTLSVDNGGTGVSRLIGLIAAFSGVDTTTANDATPVTGSGEGTSTAGIAITTVTDGAMLVLVVGIDPASATDPTFSVTDGGAGLSWNYITCYEPSGFRKVVLAYAIKPTAGATTVTGNFTISAGYGATLYALRPAAGGGGGSSILRQIIAQYYG